MTYLKSNELFEKLAPERLYQQVPHPLLIADHLLTPDNLGAMIRLADNIGATEVCFLGKEEEHRLGKVRRAAASSRDNIRWYFTEETDLRKIVPENKKIVAIETSDDATCIYDTQLPEDVAFIVGRESQGLSEELLAQCDIVVYIPVPGPTRSLNVSHAAAVALFEWQRQMLNAELTASWEKGLSMVASGTIGEQEYMVKLEAFVTKMTESVKKLNNQSSLYGAFQSVEGFYTK